MGQLKIAAFCFLVFGVTTCTNSPKSEEKPGISLEITEIPAPCKEGGEGNLFLDENQQLYLSWIEYANDTTDVLMFSRLVENAWGKPVEIARGNNWFVNWADFPALVVYDKGRKMAAHWLQKSAAGTYDYDVKITQSSDGGKNWTTPFVLHKDGINAEHGFVSMFPKDTSVFAVWLDGRNTKGGHGHDAGHSDSHGHGHAGAMTLRAADFDNNGKVFNSVELDDRVCDCCQTAAVAGTNGPLVVYRDRLPGEIRDISIVRKSPEGWTSPVPVHADGWEMKACPVNGPAIDANGKHVVVAWYTMADGIAKVLLATSTDDGATFGKPLRLDGGDPLGRVDVVLVKETAYVSWIEKDKVYLAAVRSGKLTNKFVVDKTSSSRKSGFPIMKYKENQLFFVWTTVDGEKTRLKTVVVDLNA